MQTTPINRVIQHLLAACGWDGDGLTDGELLTRFLNNRDAAALGALVRRHGSMVWGVCCRLLRSHHDAEDAFQATFLVLVQKAATLPDKETVGMWLYGVAHQTAVRMRAIAAKRGVRERQVTVMPEPATAEQYVWNDLLPVLDEELSRLPDKYRVLVVLCDLEGVTRKEVARRLGIPEGTAATRLAAARAMLAKRLTRRGLAVSGGSLAATLSHSVASADVPTTVVTSAINVATLLAAGKAAGVISGPVATLTQGVLKTMFLKKIAVTAGALLLLGVAVVAGGSLAVGQLEPPNKPKAGQDVPPPVEKPVKQEAKQKQEEEPFTAWGEEQPGGVQVGLGYLPGEKRVYRTGESVTLVVRARGVGKQEVNLEYVRELWINFPPTITDGGGKKYAMPKVWTNLETVPTQVTLKAGKETELYRMKLDLRPGGEADDKQVMKVFGTGKFQIQEEIGLIGRVWVGQDRAAATDRNLPSGKLELEVTDKPPVSENKPLRVPAKPEARKVYSPDEVVREKYDAVATRTVEFKVVVVAKPTPIKQSPDQGAPWVIGHGLEDVSLLPYPPKKVDEREFSVILTSKVVDQLKRIGVKDVGKHFDGKTIRVSGRIHQHRYISDDPPEEPHYDLVIEDVSQIEAVE